MASTKTPCSSPVTSLSTVPAEIRINIWRYLLLARRNRTVSWPLARPLPKPFTWSVDRVRVSNVIDVDPLYGDLHSARDLWYGDLHSDRPLLNHQLISYSLHTAALTTSTRFYAECKDVLYVENGLIAIGWNGRMDVQGVQHDILQRLGIQSRWSVPIEQYAKILKYLPDHAKPMLQIDVTLGASSEVMLLPMLDIGLAMRALFMGFIVPRHSLSSMISREGRELSKLRHLRIKIARGNQAEALLKTHVAPWLGESVFDLWVNGRSLLSTSATIDTPLQESANMLTNSLDETPAVRSLTRIKQLEQKLIMIEQSYKATCFDGETVSMVNIAESLLSLLSQALDTIRPLGDAETQPLQKDDRVLRVLHIGAWHLSHVHVQLPSWRSDETCAIIRHQLLHTIGVAVDPIPSGFPASWKVHLYLQASRLALLLGHDKRGIVLLLDAVKHAAAPTQMTQVQVTPQKWAIDQLLTARAWKRELVKGGSRVVPDLVTNVQERMLYEYKELLDAWAEWKEYDKTPEIWLSDFADVQVETMD